MVYNSNAYTNTLRDIDRQFTCVCCLVFDRIYICTTRNWRQNISLSLEKNIEVLPAACSYRHAAAIRISASTVGRIASHTESVSFWFEGDAKWCLVFAPRVLGLLKHYARVYVCVAVIDWMTMSPIHTIEFTLHSSSIARFWSSTSVRQAKPPHTLTWLYVISLHVIKGETSPIATRHITFLYYTNHDDSNAY